ncbi:UpxY family transcription antiterminator [Flavobacterium sp.]|uniref:UpxY family transcription antiterminator n=1 Tax=Flavobacterium sp. TaxID=239 RepID=UPI00391BB1EB
MSWYVLYTKPRNEKKVTVKLQELGFVVYCPLVTVVKQWSDRKKRVEEPLLPSYVFVQLEEKNRDQVFQVAGIVRYLYWLGKPAMVREEEIDTLRSWLSSDSPKLQVEQLQRGTKITLKEGLFSGMDAVVKEHRGKKVQLILESLGIVVIMEVQ